MCGTLSSHKNEILFQEFGINYNNEPAIFKKGTTLVRKLVQDSIEGKLRPTIVPLADDIIGDRFWIENSEILGLKSLVVYKHPVPIQIQNTPTPQPLPIKPLSKNYQNNSIMKNSNMKNTDVRETNRTENPVIGNK